MPAFIEAQDSHSAGERTEPAVVRLPARDGLEPSRKPPVRIFLGTEEAQYKAERIFFYSIEQVRDPARIYEIYLMKNLAGFNRRWWRTGFTNYRFAIPDFAGRRGKAIYNDVDQVYTADPALLFDRDMEGHGYLAISPSDTSVMLIDCERMAPWWNRHTASHRHKHSLTRGPAAEPGLWGQLAPGWNARDTEYVEGESMLLHFTALHLQPWQPTPEHYSYRPNPMGEVWHRLKRAADGQGYQVFTAASPSPDYPLLLAKQRAAGIPAGGRPWSASARQKLAAVGPLDRWQIGVGPGARQDHDEHGQHFDLATGAWPAGSAEALLAIDCLERLPAEDVPWALDALFERARRLLYLAVHCGPSDYTLADGSNLHRCQRSPDWWREQIVAAARHHPQTAWHLDLQPPANSDQPLTFCASRPADVIQDARVCLLLEGDAAAEAAGRRLAETLGRPWEERSTLDRDTPTAMDLILTSGPNGARQARQWRRQTDSDALLVHLGAPGAPLTDFDLVISRPQDQLPIRRNVLYLARPLAPLDHDTMERAAQRLRPALATLPGPWISLLAGGGDLPSRLDPATARELGRLAGEHVRARGGSLVIAPYPGTPADAVTALATAADCPAYCPQPGEIDALTAYHGAIGVAEAFIVTSDNADSLAAACARECPVAVYELAPCFDKRSLRTQRWQWLFDRSIRHKSHRGTPRQQDWRGRIFDWLISRGHLAGTHDPRVLLQTCLVSGLAGRLHDTAEEAPIAPAPPAPEDLVRRRIQQLMSYQCT